ncbi:MAG: hypothetical protein J6A04_05755 [Clostridia bacterium]|nr:hypothetical protein [Clostridia bacterium]
MKKLTKIVIFLLICLFVIYSPTYALTDPIENPGAYEPATNPTSNNTEFIERANVVLGVIRAIGSFVAVITLMTLGIRYMLASTSDKALYKETMIPYLIGAIMVFTIPNLIGILFDIVTSNIK